MKCQTSLLVFLSILTASTLSFASVPQMKKSEEAKLMQELTGKAPVKAVAVAKAPAVAITKQHLNAGFYAYTRKDYIKALKHYNAIIVKYPKSPEVKNAYLAKAKLYQEMGLIEQAQLNVRLANGSNSQTK